MKQAAPVAMLIDEQASGLSSHVARRVSANHIPTITQAAMFSAAMLLDSNRPFAPSATASRLIDAFSVSSRQRRTASHQRDAARSARPAFPTAGDRVWPLISGAMLLDQPAGFVASSPPR